MACAALDVSDEKPNKCGDQEATALCEGPKRVLELGIPECGLGLKRVDGR